MRSVYVSQGGKLWKLSNLAVFIHVGALHEFGSLLWLYDL
jgi:hypothetical protein